VRNERLSVIAMRVSNKNRSAFTIHSCDTAPTPAGFAEIVSDDFPILSSEFKLTMNRRLQFQKCGEHFIGVHYEAPDVLALCGHNPKLSLALIRT
jgi:hypothetical protein